MAFLFKTVFVRPLYNILLGLGAILPGQSLGLAIIVLTLAVRLALFPLQHRMLKTQKALKELEPEIRRIKGEQPKNQTEQARRMMELYRQHGVNPLSGFLLLLIQIPILLALFYVFRDSFILDGNLVYSVLAGAAALKPTLFGLIDLTGRSYLLAILAGVTQWGQLSLAQFPSAKLSPNALSTLSPAEQASQKMLKPMRYFLPVMITVAAVTLPSAISLYWVTSNLFSLTHEWWLKKKVANQKSV